MTTSSDAPASAVDPRSIDSALALGMARTMLRVRSFEDLAARAYTQGKAGGFMHLYNGQEASGVGAMLALRPEDVVMTHYRDHGYALLRGSTPEEVMSELFGRATGTTGMDSWSCICVQGCHSTARSRCIRPSLPSTAARCWARRAMPSAW